MIVHGSVFHGQALATAQYRPHRRRWQQVLVQGSVHIQMCRNDLPCNFDRCHSRLYFPSSYYTLLYPTGDGDAHESHMSLYLAIANRDDEPLDWWKQCRYRLTLIHPKTGETRKKAGTNEFDSDCRNWGWRDFVSLSEVCSSHNSYLLRCKLSVAYIHLIHFTGVAKIHR